MIREIPVGTIVEGQVKKKKEDLADISYDFESDEAKNIDNNHSNPEEFFGEIKGDNETSEKGYSINLSRTSDSFIENTVNILKQSIDEAEIAQRQVELREQEKFLESSGSTELNRMLAYSIFEKNTALLHVSPSKTLRLSEKLSLLDDGLEKLALIVANNKNIKTIKGSSWIVAKNPRLVEMAGFTIKEAPFLERMFHRVANVLKKEKSRAYKEAIMRREDFLRKYYKQN